MATYVSVYKFFERSFVAFEKMRPTFQYIQILRDLLFLLLLFLSIVSPLVAMPFDFFIVSNVRNYLKCVGTRLFF